MNENKKVEIGNIYNIGIGFDSATDAKVVKIEEDHINGDQAVLELVDFSGPRQRKSVQNLQGQDKENQIF